MSSNLNQFSQTGEVGDQDLSLFGGASVITCMYDPTDTTGYLVPGQAVVLKDCGADDIAGVPIVGKRSADTAAIFGTRKRSLKDAKVYGGQYLEVLVNGAVGYFKAGAALNRGVQVTVDHATPGNIIAKSTKASLGLLLDKAASGAIVRVLIQADGFTTGS